MARSVICVSHETGARGRELAAAVADNDAGRRDYLRQFYGVSHESPTHYDIVVNTGRIDPEAFVPIVVSSAVL